MSADFSCEGEQARVVFASCDECCRAPPEGRPFSEKGMVTAGIPARLMGEV